MNEDEWKDVSSEEELRTKVLGQGFFPSVLCAYLCLDKTSFLEDFSFSFWEELAGANRMVVADSSIRGRYHITTNNERGKTINYIIFENEKGLKKYKERIDEKFKELKKKYGGRGYLVLTDMNRFGSYSKYGLKIIGRNKVKAFTELQSSGKRNSDIGKDFNFVHYRNSSSGSLKAQI